MRGLALALVGLAVVVMLVLIALLLNRIAGILERTERLTMRGGVTLADFTPTFEPSRPFVRDTLVDSLKGPVPDFRSP